MNLLLVDDNEACIETLADIATSLGHTAAIAYDGAGCLALTSHTRFDRIFLDISLPDADGRDICSRIRAAGLSRDARIIAMTGHSDFVDGSGETGFDGYLLKPISLQALELFLLTR
ncbi:MULTISPECIES: response regulator [unclassified Caballeronia]|uniref:response regulator n=1 Tax=unclassified Caballeronia TaxID=2646786 RepID=UPI00285888BA|nr:MULTISPECIES: response regulator [unclassified Caballeronia]MDR5775104.1 response regulator [Caballeronia sp. LZ002]MDR5850542.1 response regulator [Caballeronia sp. LZ003]